MQAKKRYILVFVSCAFLAYCYFGGYRLKNESKTAHNPIELPSFVTDSYQQQTTTTTANTNHNQQHSTYRHHSSAKNSKYSYHNNDDGDNDDDDDDDLFSLPIDNDSYHNQINTKPRKPTSSCRMENCFDFTKCYEEFLVYVYPPEPVNSLGAAPPVSLNYQKIISAITESRYYTSDPNRACLFVLGIDTLDRDSLSEDYVRNVPSRLQRLPYWNNGRNHIIFNLYSGTWPGYAENSLGFDTGEAILAKASMSVQQIRPTFDISIPLFHKQHPLRAGNTGFVTSNNFPANKKYLLAFKGKR